ncbi:MAG TPA: tRNA (adenosine(37)-N6)-threonylcarbamoyltransferase complex dimerization subunit type 1 TsaB [Methyloceanibacter sp.]|jgi:tRNA threonylcarbamoyl adenosine modification protein YeaZ|nr:tRNA (adenosine(37)-N6)-threonylcarbamoyltransferase complex dimerization subunit type 1 TsaB [Methyloceanibacter sp.]
MNILALDTSMGACSAAVLRAGGGARGRFARQEEMARGHAEALMPMVAEVMQQAGLAFPDLDLIAATVGPGSFTGVRIAIAAARGLALATRAKLYGTDSLTVMAKAALAAGAVGPGPFAVAADARRGMLYLGLYDAAGRRLEGPLLIAPEEAVTLLPGGLHRAVGSGAVLLAEAGARAGRPLEAKLPELQPSAAALAEIALEAGQTSPVLQPLYLRPPDARPQGAGVARR